MNTLSPTQRRALRARAHPLCPVVNISKNGLSAPVLKEIERALKAHELIKVRIFGAERAQREALFARISATLDAAPVQHIGNVLVFFREQRDAAADVRTSAARPRRPAKSNPPRRPAGGRGR